MFLSLVGIIIEFYIRFLLDWCFCLCTTSPCNFARLRHWLNWDNIFALDCSFDGLSLSNYVHILWNMLFGAASVFCMNRLIRDVWLAFVNDDGRLIWRLLMRRNNTACAWNHSLTYLRHNGLLVTLQSRLIFSYFFVKGQ